VSRLLFHGANPCADMRYYEVQRAFQLCETLLFGSENIENNSIKSKRGRGNLSKKTESRETTEGERKNTAVFSMRIRNAAGELSSLKLTSLSLGKNKFLNFDTYTILTFNFLFV